MARKDLIHLLERRTFDCRPVSIYNHDLIQSLQCCHPYRIVQCLQFCSSTFYSTRIEPFENKFLLNGDSVGEVRIFMIDSDGKPFLDQIYTKKFSEHPIYQVEWYTKDSGLFALVDGERRLHVIDTNRSKAINDYNKSKTNIKSFDWNRDNSHLIAVGISRSSFGILDLRECTFPVRHRVSSGISAGSQPDISHVLWDPIDEVALWLGNDVGEIFLYDIRYTKAPIYQHLESSLAHRPMIYMAFTPDTTRLITCHGIDSHLIAWKLGHNSNDQAILKDSRINFSQHCKVSTANITAAMHAQAENLELLVTNDEIYLPNIQFPTGPKVFIYDIYTGRLRSELLEKDPPEQRYSKPYSVVGFGRTCWGDEPNPAIIYSGVNSIVVQKMSEKYNNRLELADRYHQDFWSDEEDEKC